MISGLITLVALTNAYGWIEPENLGSGVNSAG